jgi:hypothetical protein
MDDIELIRPVGESLVSFSRHARSSARGLITLMFPYIFAASKRMSTRAISAYLEQVHQVNISAATIAKALREPQKHVSYLAESVEPAARVVAEALEVDVRELLDNEKLFISTTDAPPSLGGASERQIADAHQTYVNARRHLERCWYRLDGSVQAMVVAMIEGSESELDEPLLEDASK